MRSGWSDFFSILLIGGIQFGLMYTTFQASFYFLEAHEVALLLVTTPAYVTLIGNAMAGNGTRWSVVLAAMAMILPMFLTDFAQKFCFRWQGVLLTQACNFSFAFGQVSLRRFCQKRGIENILRLNAILYLGAAIVCLPFVFFVPHGSPWTDFSWTALVKTAAFGVICCGVCHWLWNVGAIRSTIPVLSAMNNLQIPLAIIVACTIFGEKIHWPRFVGSFGVVAILFVSAFLSFGKDDPRDRSVKIVRPLKKRL
jgi:drug/metabolite transporter (DMT)-like permease